QVKAPITRSASRVRGPPRDGVLMHGAVAQSKVRHVRLRRLRPLHHLVSGRHRSHGGGGRDPCGARPAAWRMTPYVFHPARIIDHRVEAEGIHTFTMRFTEPRVRRAYRFAAGQFNMLYAYGVGEVPISIVSDPEEPKTLEHTISAVGRVTNVMARWKVGDVAGVRGPYGRGWPVDEARGREVIIVTGGLGCAPVVGVIDYIFRRRDEYGALHILHGVKTPR